MDKTPIDAEKLSEELEDICDCAYIEENAEARRELYTRTRDASESVMSAGFYLKSCNMGFFNALHHGDLELAEFYLEKMRSVVPQVLPYRGWKDLILAQCEYTLSLNKHDYAAAKSFAAIFLDALRKQEESMRHSLFVDLPRANTP